MKDLVEVFQIYHRFHPDMNFHSCRNISILQLSLLIKTLMKFNFLDFHFFQKGRKNIGDTLGCL